MNDLTTENRRILVVDDSEEIHSDFRRILTPGQSTSMQTEDEALLFGVDCIKAESGDNFEIDFAVDGEAAISRVLEAEEEGHSYAMAFVDVRMPPGMDGLETASHIWKIAPEMQVVLCTAYSDHSFVEKMRKLDRADQLLILKKPFDPIEVRQLVRSMSRNWLIGRQLDSKLESLERLVAARTEQLRTAYDMARERTHERVDILERISDEFRGPLSAIMDFARTLRRDGDITQAPPARIESIDTILHTSRHLLGITDGILDLSHLEAGKLEMDFGPHATEALGLQIGNALRAVAEGNGMGFDFQIASPLPPRIYTDAERLKQAIVAIGSCLQPQDGRAGCLTLSVKSAEEDSIRFELTAEDAVASDAPDSVACPALKVSLSEQMADALGADLSILPPQGRTQRITLTVPTDGPGVKLDNGDAADECVVGDEREWGQHG